MGDDELRNVGELGGEPTCPECGSANPPDCIFCLSCGAMLPAVAAKASAEPVLPAGPGQSPVDGRQPTDADLYDAFVNPRASKAEIAALSVENATRMVAYRRKSKVSPEMRDLPLSDEMVAEAIVRHAQSASLEGAGGSQPDAEEPAVEVECPECGSANPPDCIFCLSCGAMLPAVETRPPAMPAPQARAKKRRWGCLAAGAAGFVLLGLLLLLFVVPPSSGGMLRLEYAVGRRDFGGANLSGADLTGASLSGTNLNRANLRGADLRGADLWQADLSGANLTGADLRGAELDRTSLRGAVLDDATRIDARWRLVYEIQTLGAPGRDLAGANLSWAYLGEADLSGANLSGANLLGADLSEANLAGADLTDASVSDAQLAQAASLKGATMPDGTVRE